MFGEAWAAKEGDNAMNMYALFMQLAAAQGLGVIQPKQHGVKLGVIAATAAAAIANLLAMCWLQSS